MKIGIFGGTFDPVHTAHLIMAEHVLDSEELDRIWLMPAAVPPHKQGEEITDGRHRFRMLQLAVQDHPQLEVSSYELDKKGVSYTYETIRELKQHYPDHQFQFIIGADMVEYLPNWHRINELLSMVQFIAVARKGYRLDQPFTEHRVKKVDVPEVDISSSMIRERVRDGRSIRYLVPESVRAYIKEQGLYGAG
ncbi:MAG: nicotinate-nucleotide adenylyltransferase [Bacillaceae bacterium]|nr:nicotinate-nucleotide adenylyltransferase [Bacillaceae bacterium]